MWKNDFDSLTGSEKSFDVTMACDICGRTFTSHLHVHEGHALKLYGAHCCDNCWSGNWDGWNPKYEAKILALLKDKGLPVPARNENGLLPRD